MKKLQTVIGMIFLFGNSFGQTEGLPKENGQVGKNTTQTYLDPIINLVSSNLNYGSSNSALSDYKKSVRGAQVGVSFQAGITPRFSLVSDFYLMMNGGKLKANNPLTVNETTLRFYSLELPVLARVHLSNFYVNAGPSIGYTLSGTKKTN
ncbi:MAG: PorT family protein, partial [Segetibacter sp.]|nr:PorT family protein [Segetibacter sp.]